MTSGSFGSCPSLKRVIQIHLFVILSPTYHKRKESHAMETVQAGLFPPSLLPSWLRAPSCLPRYHNSDLKRLHRIVLCSLKNRKLCLNSFVKFGLSFRTRQCAVTLEVKLAKDPSQVVRAYSLRLQSTVCLGPELDVAEHLYCSQTPWAPGYGTDFSHHWIVSSMEICHCCYRQLQMSTFHPWY